MSEIRTAVHLTCALNPPADAAHECLNNKLADFERTVRNHHAQFVWVARRITPFHEDAEDIVQESLLRAYRNLSDFRGEAKMSTWIQSIIRNTARDWLRRQRGRVLLSLEHMRNEADDAGGFDVVDPERSPEDSLALSELERIMLAEVDRLNENYRGAITACQLSGMAQAEAASRFQVSVMTLKSRIFKAKANLRRSMERIGAFKHAGLHALPADRTGSLHVSVTR
ncbi:MAG TPA: RNA polymerase sigma factor [Terracidiphilus sp.]|nr:RNA polymerase sigma factor [Terracidiphilus sp.]